MLTPTVLYRGQPAATSTTLYTVTNTAGKHAIIKNIMICNPTAASATITMGSVESGGTLVAARYFLSAMVVAPGQTIQFDLSMVLAQNESLRALCSAATTLTVIVSGVIN